MSKRIVSLVLALMMCCAFTPMISLAANNMSLDKATYDPGSSITLTVSGITAEMEQAYAWVAIFKQGTSYDDYGDWQYVEKGTKQYSFTAPVEGKYEFRLFGEYAFNATTVIDTLHFTVSNAVTTPQPTLSSASPATSPVATGNAS